MAEREWLLGEDLVAEDNLLDGFTFDDVIMQVQCNSREINREAVGREVMDLLELRLDDMKELFYRNIDRIVAEARKGREA